MDGFATMKKGQSGGSTIIWRTGVTTGSTPIEIPPIKTFSNSYSHTKKFFTVVNEVNSLHIFERPDNTSMREIRKSIKAAYITPLGRSRSSSKSRLKYKLTGKYPNWYVEEKQ